LFRSSDKIRKIKGAEKPTNMINIAVIGIGRIGRIHADNIATNAGANLRVICDTRPEAARIVAEQYSVAFCASPEEVIQDKTIDAVFICTPAHTHIDLANAAIENGKYVFCEKPLDEDLEKARRFVQADGAKAGKMMVGFNRRYDESHQKLRKTIVSGALGRIEQIVINSRDPRIDSYAVLQKSGGIFRDMMIHDIDQASLLMQDDFVGVFARGTCLVDPIFAKHDDFDNAVATFWTTSGAICTIVNSRRSSFGFEQTIEIFCSGGTAAIKAPPGTTLSIRDRTGEHLAGPEGHFAERYQKAYQAECQAFIDAIASGKEFPALASDGLKALNLGAAADRSAHLGQAITIQK
jgi:myo-inositol 2-dehydrogenase/D-chiro-inositol 1-dehydrogenase